MSLAITCRTGCFEMAGYRDASWETTPDNGKSTSGYLLIVTGGPSSFKTTLQSVTAESTLEAELISIALASKEAA